MLISEFSGKSEDVVSLKDHRVEMRNPKLTNQEMEVLRGLNSGLANKEIADKLGMSEENVQASLREIMKKLRVTRHLKAIINAVSRSLK